MTLSRTYVKVRNVLEKARITVYKNINKTMVHTYWHIGRAIVEQEQKDSKKMQYGTSVLAKLSKKLKSEYGRGFTERNLRSMRNFYLFFPKWNAVSSELSWTHYRLLLRIKEKSERQFYFCEAIDNNWSTRELERQISFFLYERVILSKDREKVKRVSRKGQIVKKPEDIMKDFLEFLNLKENKNLFEKNIRV